MYFSCCQREILVSKFILIKQQYYNYVKGTKCKISFRDFKCYINAWSVNKCLKWKFKCLRYDITGMLLCYWNTFWTSRYQRFSKLVLGKDKMFSSLHRCVRIYVNWFLGKILSWYQNYNFVTIYPCHSLDTNCKVWPS